MFKCICGLTHCSWETHKRLLANSADPDQLLQNVASDQGPPVCMSYRNSCKT